jgi:predicted regulator of Ras-like GTPase activity (Roadblock/LC7/MglB family)
MARSVISDEKRTGILREIIQGLETLPGVNGWAVVSQEGLVIDQKMPASVNPHLLAGNTAALAHSAQVVIAQTGAGPMDTLVLKGKNSVLVIVGGEEELIFLVMTKSNSNLDSLTSYLTDAAKRFHSI